MKVCANCFNDIELKSFVSSNSTQQGVCDYCKGEKTDLLDLSDLLDFFTEFFDIFKNDNNGEPLTYLINKDWGVFSNYGETDNNRQIIGDILKAIESDIPNYGAPVVYTDTITDSLNLWETLKEKLKWESRFLTNLNDLEDYGWDYYFSKNKVNIPNTDILYRARIHKNGQKGTYQKKDMGYPDKTKVSDGRANPIGIPYLYLSKSEKTTLYETRVAYLDEVSIGEFMVKGNQSLSLVDFTTISSAFAYNDDSYGSIEDFAVSVLLKNKISKELSKPLRRYDSIIEYIPTQFICEYIRYITGADGILFASSLHKGGENIVLFGQDKVECINVKEIIVTDVDIKFESIK